MCPADPVRPYRISIYALGGGAGHLTRGSGLARALVARGHRCQLIIPAERCALAAALLDVPGAAGVDVGRALGWTPEGRAGALTAELDGSRRVGVRGLEVADAGLATAAGMDDRVGLRAELSPPCLAADRGGADAASCSPATELDGPVAGPGLVLGAAGAPPGTIGAGGLGATTAIELDGPVVAPGLAMGSAGVAGDGGAATAIGIDAGCGLWASARGPRAGRGRVGDAGRTSGADGSPGLEAAAGPGLGRGEAVQRYPIARCGPAALLAAVQDGLTSFGAQLLVVDALPAGVLSELGSDAALPCARVLVARRLRRAPVPELLARYARVFDVEPALPWAPSGRTTRLAPIAAPSAAAAGAEVVCVAGDAAQARLLWKVAVRLGREGFGVALAYDGWLQRPGQAPARARPVPLVGARLLIGPAGYNLVYEARALGVPQLALPLPKAWDDQVGRADAVAHRPASPEALMAQARAWLTGAQPPAPVGPDPQPPTALADAICAALPALSLA